MTSPPPQPSRRPLGFDDFVGILVAFLTIGGILFWTLGRREPGFVSSVLTPAAVPGSPVASPTVTPEASPLATVEPLESPSPRVIVQRPNIAPVPVPVSPIATPSAAPASPEASPSPAPTFSDVPANYWAAPFIANLERRNIITGFQDNTFKPDEPVTRAQFAAMLQEAFTNVPQQRQPVLFKDVASNFWGASAIAKAYGNGFLQGYPNSVFQPQQQIPRVQVIASLASGLQLAAPANAASLIQKYQDASQIPGYATDKVAAATQVGIVVNHPNLANLEPNRRATRAEVAALVYQAMVEGGLAQPIESQYVVKP